MGPFTFSGEWSGIMGNVILGNCPLSVNNYILFYERSSVLNFATLHIGNSFGLFLKPVPPERNVSFYARPITKNVWLCSFVLVIFATIIIFGARYITISSEETKGNLNKFLKKLR